MKSKTKKFWLKVVNIFLNILLFIFNPITLVIILVGSLYITFFANLYSMDTIEVNFSNCSFLFSLVDLIIPFILPFVGNKKKSYCGLEYSEFRKLRNSFLVDLTYLGTVSIVFVFSLMIFIGFGQWDLVIILSAYSGLLMIYFFVWVFPVLAHSKTYIKKIAIWSLPLWKVEIERYELNNYRIDRNSVEYKVMTYLLLSTDSGLYMDDIIKSIKHRKKIKRGDIIKLFINTQSCFFNDFNKDIIPSCDDKNSFEYNGIKVVGSLSKSLSNIKILINTYCDLYSNDAKSHEKIVSYAGGLIENCFKTIEIMSLNDDLDNAIYETLETLLNKIGSKNKISEGVLINLFLWDCDNKRTNVIKQFVRFSEKERMSKVQSEFYIYMFLFYDILNRENLGYFTKDEKEKYNLDKNLIAFISSNYELITKIDSFSLNQLHRGVCRTIFLQHFHTFVFLPNKYDDTFILDWWNNNVIPLLKSDNIIKCLPI